MNEADISLQILKAALQYRPDISVEEATEAAIRAASAICRPDADSHSQPKGNQHKDR